MCPHAFSLFILAYSSAKQTSDNIKIDKIENIMKQKQVNEKYKEMFEIICEYYNILFEQSSIEEVEQAYKNITRKYSWELPVKAEITYEYFYYIYKNTDLDKVTYHNTLNDCINYALNELIIDTQDTTIIKPIDETILRLKINYTPIHFVRLLTNQKIYLDWVQRPIFYVPQLIYLQVQQKIARPAY